MRGFYIKSIEISKYLKVFKGKMIRTGLQIDLLFENLPRF